MKQKHQKEYTYLQKKDKLLMNSDWYNNIILKYQKIANLLDNTSNESSKFRTKNQVEINDESRGTCSVNRQIDFKTSMLRSSLFDYSDAYTC